MLSMKHFTTVVLGKIILNELKALSANLPKWRPGDLGSSVSIFVNLSTSLFLLVTSS